MRTEWNEEVIGENISDVLLAVVRLLEAKGVLIEDEVVAELKALHAARPTLETKFAAVREAKRG